MGPKQKVLCYITAGPEDIQRVCVFSHIDFPEAGIQVPGGSIEPGEPPERSALREAFEESGITGLIIRRCLGRFEWICDDGFLHHRHVYHLVAPVPQPETWEHIVTAGDGDKGLRFSYYWLDITVAEKTLSGDQGSYLSLLQ